MDPSATPSAIPHTFQPATDAEMRQLIYAHTHVLVAYVTADCENCQDKLPSLEQLAHERRFAHVLFLRLDAADNVVPVREIAANNAPFVSVYQRGRLAYCGTVQTKKELAELLLEHCPAAD